MVKKEKVHLGRIYKIKSLEKYSMIARFPRYVILTHNIYPQKGEYMTRYRFFDIGYSSVAGAPISEYDILTFYRLVEYGEWQD